MKIRSSILAAVAAVCAISWSGCGDPPQPIDTPKAAGSGASEEARVAGTVVLEGAQFEAPKGTLWVSVRPTGMKAPWLSHKYPLEGAQFGKSPEGAKTLAFDFSSRDPMNVTFNSNGMHSAPSECEVYACYKVGGTVDLPTLADAAATYVPGKRDYVLTLKLP